MNNFIFENGTKAILGAGCVKEYLFCFLSHYGNNVMFAYGGGSIRKNGIYDEIVWILQKGGKRIIEFEPVPLCVVVTVSGTGSEMNGGAVITNEALKVKTGRDYPRCNPRLALLDPTYTYSVPAYQVASGGFDSLSHMMEIYFSGPDEPNVSDDIAEALMRGVIRDLRAAIRNPEDYTARSNLMWEAAMAENRIVKLGKKTDFECRMMEHQLSAFTGCNHGAGLAVLHPMYYRHIYKDGLSKFRRFAVEVWGIPADGRTDEQMALAGIEALENFIAEIGLPKRFRDLGVDERTDLKAVADSCTCVPGAYRAMTHDEILKIFKACC